MTVTEIREVAIATGLTFEFKAGTHTATFTSQQMTASSSGAILSNELQVTPPCKEIVENADSVLATLENSSSELTVEDLKDLLPLLVPATKHVRSKRNEYKLLPVPPGALQARRLSAHRTLDETRHTANPPELVKGLKTSQGRRDALLATCQQCKTVLLSVSEENEAADRD
jgi:hypothetical protein